MRWILVVIMAFAAAPVFATETLSDKFFIECPQSTWDHRLLILVDKQAKTMAFKTPKLYTEKFVEDADSFYFMRNDTKYYFNKWDKSFCKGSEGIYECQRDCEILDPDSRQPLFK